MVDTLYCWAFVLIALGSADDIMIGGAVKVCSHLPREDWRLLSPLERRRSLPSFSDICHLIGLLPPPHDFYEVVVNNPSLLKSPNGVVKICPPYQELRGLGKAKKS
jgi:hypothetical protein